MIWECDACHAVIESDPTACDDWDGESRACGPRCHNPECDYGGPMDYLCEGRIVGDTIIESSADADRP